MARPVCTPLLLMPVQQVRAIRTVYALSTTGITQGWHMHQLRRNALCTCREGGTRPNSQHTGGMGAMGSLNATTHAYVLIAC